jgi:hypothetical protein
MIDIIKKMLWHVKYNSRQQFNMLSFKSFNLNSTFQCGAISIVKVLIAYIGATAHQTSHPTETLLC